MTKTFISIDYHSIQTNTKPEYYVLAFDTEQTGPSFLKHKMMALGATVMTPNSIEVAHFEVNLEFDPNPNGPDMDHNTWTEFWSKPENTESFNKCLINPVKCETAICNFVKWFHECERNFPNLRMASDNPGYDVGWISYYLNKYTPSSVHPGEVGSLQTIWLDGRQRQARSTKTLVDTCLILKKVKNIKDLNFKHTHEHDHTPLNDARGIAEDYNQALELITLYNAEFINLENQFHRTGNHPGFFKSLLNKIRNPSLVECMLYINTCMVTVLYIRKVLK